jgi:S1-C subfamily serine protease
MSKRASAAWMFLAGVAVTALVLVVVVAAGVIPVKTETKTVVRTTPTASTSTVALNATSSAEGLTPAQIYQQYSAGVVEVFSTFAASQSQSFDPLGQQSSGAAQALGSGFVVSADGYILTNAHVVEDNGTRASSVSVMFKDADGTDSTKVPATIVGVDETSDVALLKIDPAKAPQLTPVTLGDSDNVQVGEPVVAIGNPLGYDFTVTSGIVSALNRNLESPNGSVIPDGIQTDAAINSGNSGGPLFNSRGEVIGINEQIATQSGGNEGLGFAVPINTAKNALEQLKSSGKVSYAWLGIQGQSITSDVATALNLKVDNGVLIAAVTQGGPAEKAGLKGGAQQSQLQGQTLTAGGDIITAIDGETVSGMEDLIAIINQHKPGDTVTLTVLSGGSSKDVDVTLTERPADL